MHKQEEKQRNRIDDNRNGQPIVLAETDGSMIPMVKAKPKPEGYEVYAARKQKEHFLTATEYINSLTTLE